MTSDRSMGLTSKDLLVDNLKVNHITSTTKMVADRVLAQVYDSLPQPCTGLNELSVGDGKGNLTCLSPGDDGSLMTSVSGTPSWLPPGEAGSVLTSVSGTPTWVEPSSSTRGYYGAQQWNASNTVDPGGLIMGPDLFSVSFTDGYIQGVAGTDEKWTVLTPGLYQVNINLVVSLLNGYGSTYVNLMVRINDETEEIAYSTVGTNEDTKNYKFNLTSSFMQQFPADTTFQFVVGSTSGASNVTVHQRSISFQYLNELPP